MASPKSWGWRKHIDRRPRGWTFLQFRKYFTLIIFIIGLKLVGKTTAIKCIECADPSFISRMSGDERSVILRPPCTNLYPKKYVHHMDCRGEHNVCVKIVIFDGGLYDNGEKYDIIIRRCSSSFKYYHQHNNLTRFFSQRQHSTDRCYTTELPYLISPPHEQEFCLCHTDMCNGAARTLFPLPYDGSPRQAVGHLHHRLLILHAYLCAHLHYVLGIFVVIIVKAWTRMLILYF